MKNLFPITSNLQIFQTRFPKKCIHIHIHNINTCYNGTALYKTVLTHQLVERHECVLTIVATDALGLKHQAICIHSAD